MLSTVPRFQRSKLFKAARGQPLRLDRQLPPARRLVSRQRLGQPLEARLEPDLLLTRRGDPTGRAAVDLADSERQPQRRCLPAASCVGVSISEEYKAIAD